MNFNLLLLPSSITWKNSKAVLIRTRLAYFCHFWLLLKSPKMASFLAIFN
jgi:hypothetical protein